APNAPSPEAAAPGAPDTDAAGAAGCVPWRPEPMPAPGSEPRPAPAVEPPPDSAARGRVPLCTTTPHKTAAPRGRRPSRRIARARPPAAQSPRMGQLEPLWNTGIAESTQHATKLRDVAALAPQAAALDLRDEAEYLIAQALRTTIHHAGRLLTDARTATTHLP